MKTQKLNLLYINSNDGNAKLYTNLIKIYDILHPSPIPYEMDLFDDSMIDKVILKIKANEVAHIFILDWNQFKDANISINLQKWCNRKSIPIFCLLSEWNWGHNLIREELTKDLLNGLPFNPPNLN